MIKILRADLEDAGQLLEIQKKAFKKYSDIYGDFESNPYHMSFQRMKFNINYRFGKYYKIVFLDKIIGGIFCFMLDDEKSYKIAQFYISEQYQNKGYGKQAFQLFFDDNKEIKMWLADTILEEEKNLNFYFKFGFKIIDKEEEHQGLTFVTLLKK